MVYLIRLHYSSLNVSDYSKEVIRGLEFGVFREDYELFRLIERSI